MEPPKKIDRKENPLKKRYENFFSITSMAKLLFKEEAYVQWISM
jgi:hypothetical protein